MSGDPSGALGDDRAHGSADFVRFADAAEGWLAVTNGSGGNTRVSTPIDM
ncbi:MAG: hypothetical protein JOZ07_05520 [Solirubrobacterales bacterium]|nr:hypothetical protein [Solirubrobacterales bacterium]